MVAATVNVLQEMAKQGNSKDGAIGYIVMSTLHGLVLFTVKLAVCAIAPLLNNSDNTMFIMFFFHKFVLRKKNRNWVAAINFIELQIKVAISFVIS